MSKLDIPQYPKDDIKMVLSYTDPEKAMSCLLADMENKSLWQNTVSRRVGCLGVVYWRTACDGLASILDENGADVIRESMALLRELGAERSVKVLENFFELFPGDVLPEDYWSIDPDLHLEDKKKVQMLDELFLSTFLEDEQGLSRLHSYVSNYKNMFSMVVKKK